MKLVCALVAAAVSFAAAASTVPAVAQEVIGQGQVTGAGSTFAYPVLSRWNKSYQRWVHGEGEFAAPNSGLGDPPAGPALDYEPIGSLAGIMRVKERAVDFGASEMPLKTEDLQKLGLVQFPFLIGGVVVAYNIEGVRGGDLRLTGELIADIFLGKVQTWSDPAIKALNPGLKLPDAKIAVVHRADGSGTTYNFTDYLSKMSAQWRDSVGSDLAVKWPTGTGAKGNDGIAQAVKQTRNAIGYVEYAQAVLSGVSFAAMRNHTGLFVTPDRSGFQAAAIQAEWEKTSDFQMMMTNMPGATTYPIVATVYALMPANLPARRARLTLNFFDWVLERGGAEAGGLGYVPLPPSLVTQVKGYWSSKYGIAF